MQRPQGWTGEEKGGGGLTSPVVNREAHNMCASLFFLCLHKPTVYSVELFNYLTI